MSREKLSDSHLDRWTPEACSLFEEATSLRDQRQLVQARDVANRALNALRADQQLARGAVMREIGHTHYLVDDFESALPWFVSARDASERSELSSLCVFHTLFDLGRLGEALMEALRFSGIKASAEYLEMFSIGFIDGLPERNHCAATQVRAKFLALQRGEK